MKHICEVIYEMCGGAYIVGAHEGICVITGKKAKGELFNEWASSRFTDYASLKAGTIISNEAAQCFDEQSEVIQQKVGAQVPQRFRNYSHIITVDGEWFCLSKSEKETMLQILLDERDRYACITTSGQKHILFKTTSSAWNFDGRQVSKNSCLLKYLNDNFLKMMSIGVNKSSIEVGRYLMKNLSKPEIHQIVEAENNIKPHRGTAIFDLSLYLTQLKK